MDEEKFAEIARQVMAETLHAEFVAFNEQMMDYVTKSDEEILKAIKKLRSRFAIVSGRPPNIMPMPAPQEMADQAARTREILLGRLGSYASGDYDLEDSEESAHSEEPQYSEEPEFWGEPEHSEEPENPEDG